MADAVQLLLYEGRRPAECFREGGASHGIADLVENRPRLARLPHLRAGSER